MSDPITSSITSARADSMSPISSLNESIYLSPTCTPSPSIEEIQSVARGSLVPIETPSLSNNLKRNFDAISTPSLTPIATPLPTVLNAKKKAKHLSGITEALILKLNDRPSNGEDRQLVRQLIERMVAVAGERCAEDAIDLPGARCKLAMLVDLNDVESALYALDQLIAILRQDPLTKTSASRLIELATFFAKKMTKEWLQTKTIDLQIKIAQVHHELIELILFQYTEKNVNAITEELKSELKDASNALIDLNRQENAAIKFHSKCALEALHLLTTDEKTLWVILGRVSKIVAGIGSIVLKDRAGAAAYFKSAFKGISPHIKQSWYEAVLTLKTLAKKAMTDARQLDNILGLISTKYRKLNWKFSYAAVHTLKDLCLFGGEETVRAHAFSGIEQLGLPGLDALLTTNDLRSYPSTASLAYGSGIQWIDPNPRIRNVAYTVVNDLSVSARDAIVRRLADEALDEAEKLFRTDPHTQWHDAREVI